MQSEDMTQPAPPPEPASRKPTGALAPFANSDFRTLWTATIFSNFGWMIQAVGAAWIMTRLTDSPTLIALVQASNTLPVMLFALASGALADIFDKRKLMLAAQGFMFAASVVLAILTWTDALTPWLLLTMTFLIGTGAALYNPPWQASMGDLVPRKDLPAAVTLNSVGFNMMRGVGPAMGGVIVAAWGGAAAFMVNAVSYIPLLAALTRWKPPPKRPQLAGREPFLAAVQGGLRYVLLSPNLMKVLGRGALFGFAAVSIMALLPLVAKEHSEGGILFGVLLGCFGLGALLGAALNPRIRDRFNNENIVRVAFVVFAISAIVLAQTGSALISALALLPAGAAWVLALSLFNVTVQLSTPRWVVARALALYQTAVFGGMAGGSWAWGAAAGLYGWRTALVISAMLLVAGAIIGLWLRQPEFGNIDLSPAEMFRAPVPALDIRKRSGPIMVMVDYQIDKADVPEFLRLMRKRRVIRRRDGARGWALLRDLEQPQHWSESYHIATWDEYVRHNERRTVVDNEVTLALHALHRGEGDPPVHRMIERHTVSTHDDMPLMGKLDI